MMVEERSRVPPEYAPHMASAVVVREVSYQSFRHVYPDWHRGTFASRNDWIWPSLIVPESTKVASLMMFPAWNFDRSAVLTTESTTDALGADTSPTDCEVASAALAADPAAPMPPITSAAAIVHAATRLIARTPRRLAPVM